MLPAILLVAGLALAAGLILAVVSVLLAVPRDKLVDDLRDALPGINCGACGYSGCDSYAEAMAHEGAPVGLCTPGGAATLAATSALLDVESDLVRKVAVVRCGGCDSAAPRAFLYDGIRSCRAASQLYDGDKNCPYSCLGYGDCAAACQYDAISIEDGLATVVRDRCVACGMCVKACPKSLIELRPPTVAAVECHSNDKGAVVRKYCTVGCIACMKCVKACHFDAVTVKDNLSVIDPEKCTACGACVAACPTHCIHLPPQK